MTKPTNGLNFYKKANGSNPPNGDTPLEADLSGTSPTALYGEYLGLVFDLISHRAVMAMADYTQHGSTSCLEHSLQVSYISYRICKKLGLDYRSGARGALLHDFFLYDWHRDKPYRGLHGFCHPKIALQNANRHFSLNQREQDIIKSHMWPLTLRPPKYKEAYVVMLVDKYCALGETLPRGRRTKVSPTPAT
jgi:uncharacterized protein